MHEDEAGDRLPTLGPRGEGWVALQFLGLAAVLGGLLFPVSRAGPLWLVTVALGWAFAGAGVALTWTALHRLGPSLTPNPRPKDDGQLVDHGIYARARHPIYGGLLLGCLGVSLLGGSYASLIATAATALVLTLKSMREEAWLVRRYGGYRDYRLRTRRFFPWVL